MHAAFEQVGKAAKTINGKANGIWNNMVVFATDSSYVGLDGEQLKEVIKGQEKEVSSVMRFKIGENSTYRAVKSVITQARDLGISLLHGDGKTKGKTEVEKEIKEAKGEKSAADKFQSTIDTANKIEAKLEAGDVAVAAGIVKALLDKMLKRLSDLPSQA